MADWHSWVKVVHILSVIAWMAGLFYLPRLFVYHADAAVGSEMSEIFKVMERRLAKAIMRPASVATLLSGGLLFSLSGFSLLEFWLVAKLFTVALLFGFHGYLEKCMMEFSRDERVHGNKFFRILNEVPTVLLIAIVIFVVVKPFQ